MQARNDHFALFDLDPDFEVNGEALASRYRELQRQYHPDRFAHDAHEQQQALEWTTRLNEAYRVLNDPVLRAAYLLELAGQPISLLTSIADTDFLLSQLELREQLDEADSPEQLTSLRLEVMEWLDSLSREFAIDYAEQDWTEARDTVRKLHFMASFLRDIKAREDRLDDDDWLDDDED